MLQRETYGLMHFQSEALSESKNVLDILYLKTISLCLIWSFNHASKWNRGILVPRHSDSVGNSTEIFHSFARALEVQKDLVAYP